MKLSIFFFACAIFACAFFTSSEAVTACLFRFPNGTLYQVFNSECITRCQETYHTLTGHCENYSSCTCHN